MEDYAIGFRGNLANDRSAAPDDLAIPDNEDQILLDQVLETIFPKGIAGISDEAKAILILRYTCSALLLKNNYGSATKMLKDGYAYCGGMAMVFRMLARRVGLPARFVGAFYLRPSHGNHAMAEVFYGDRWRFFDATFGLFYYSKDTYDGTGTVASYSDLLADHRLWKPLQVVERPWVGRYDPVSDCCIRTPSPDYLKEMYGASIIDLHGKYADETFPVAFGEGDPVSFPVDADLREEDQMRIGVPDGDASDVDRAMTHGPGYVGSHYLGGWTPPGFHTWSIRLPTGRSRLRMTYHSVRDNPAELGLVPLRAVRVLDRKVVGKCTIFNLLAIEPEVSALVFCPRGSYLVDAMEIERVSDATQGVVPLRRKAGSRARAEQLAVWRGKADRCDELMLELPLLRYKANRHDRLEPELARLREKAGHCDVLSLELPLLRYKAERYDQFEPELGLVRYKAERFDEIAGELPRLQFKAARCDELEASLLTVRHKAERLEVLEPEVAELRRQAGRSVELEAQLAALRPKAERCETLESELPALRAKAARLEALEPELAELRRQAERCDTLEGELPALRAKAARLEALEPELAELRRQAERSVELEAQLTALRPKAERCDTLEGELPALRAKAAQLDALQPRLAELSRTAERHNVIEKALPALLERAKHYDALRTKAARYDRIEPILAELRRDARRYVQLRPDLPAMRYKAKRYDELKQADLLALRYKAQRYDQLKYDMLAWRAKANRLDRIVAVAGPTATPFLMLGRLLPARSSQ